MKRDLHYFSYQKPLLTGVELGIYSTAIYFIDTRNSSTFSMFYSILSLGAEHSFSFISPQLFCANNNTVAARKHNVLCAIALLSLVFETS